MSQHPQSTLATCADIASLLPLAGHNLLDERDAATLRAHLATCAACRAELALYDRVEAAWSRSFAPHPEASPLVSKQDILDLLTDSSNHVVSAAPTRVSARPVLPAARHSRSRRFVRGLSALAATVLIVVLVGAALLARGHTPGGAAGKATPALPPSQHISDSGLADISMVSPTEGWAVGGTYLADYNHSSNPDSLSEDVLLWHYLNGAWSPVQLPLHGRLTSISMDSPTDGWAIGENLYSQTQDRLLLLHYDGHTWKQMPAQTIRAEILGQVQMLSPSDGWIIGSVLPLGPQAAAHSGIWHYDGQTWKEDSLPTSLSDLTQKNAVQVTGISMISATEGWAVAIVTPVIEMPPSPTPILPLPQDVSPSSIILHYSGGRWEVQRPISNARLSSVSLLSASDGWIAGATTTENLVPDPNSPNGSVVNGATAPLLLRYTGGQWIEATASLHVQTSKIEGLHRVSMRSANDGWLLFFPKDQNVFSSTLLHYNGVQWGLVSLPIIKNTSSYSISDISMVSPTEGWAVGSRTVKSSSGYTLLNVPIILHYLNGAWSVAQS